MSSMAHGDRYQPEIDGLRAIAITATVLFHVKFPGFAGGFVGVDVFFVISGFLITRLLLSELALSGKIDFLAFYARRARRLLPAQILVVVTILTIGSFVLTAAGERQDLSLSAVATSAFVSNFYFWWRHADYFAGPTEWLPFLNMWSLSVEEQFYLVWPALLLLAATTARTTGLREKTIVAVILTALFCGSMTAFLWGATAKPTAAFYFTPTRVWEFALGAAVALVEKRLRRLQPVAGALAVLGLIMIAVSVALPPSLWTYSKAVPFAAFGTAILIGSFLAKPTSLLARALATGPFIIVGRLSYSWYLWHWPLLALARVHDFGEESLSRDLLLVSAALGLSALTYRYLENPIRQGRPWPFSSTRQSIAAGASLSIVVTVLAIALYWRADAVAARDPFLSNVYAARNSKVRSPPTCHLTQRANHLPSTEACKIGTIEAPPRLLLWGDSHAEHLAEMIRADGHDKGYAAIARTMSACPPFLQARDGQSQSVDMCSEFNEAVAHDVAALVRAGLTGIVLGSRLYGWDGPFATISEKATWSASLRAVLLMARSAGVRVLLTAPVPTFKFPVPECLAHLTAERCGMNRAEMERTRAPLIGALASVVAEFDNVRLWDPINLFCDASVCLPVRDGVILYSDWSHLTVLGSRRLAADVSLHLDWLRQ